MHPTAVIFRLLLYLSHFAADITRIRVTQPYYSADGRSDADKNVTHLQD